MKNLHSTSLAVCAISALAGLAQAAAFADTAPPSYDLKPQALQDLQVMQKQFTDLADAIPAEKFTWRPAEGVRSVSEVFLHVASLNFSLAPSFGASPAADFVQKGFEESTTDKAKIIAQLNQSFEYVRAALEKRSNKELQTIVKQFGPDASEGDVVFLVVSDAHEHLGQAVAYARINGIVPPWTAARMKKQAQQP
ncbi:MAG: DinB family protein [Bryobacteraceae bacterium]